MLFIFCPGHCMYLHTLAYGLESGHTHKTGPHGPIRIHFTRFRIGYNNDNHIPFRILRYQVSFNKPTVAGKGRGQGNDARAVATSLLKK